MKVFCLLLSIAILCVGCADTPSPLESSSTESQTEAASSTSQNSTPDKFDVESESDYSSLISSVYMDFPSNCRIDTTLDPGLAAEFESENIPLKEPITLSDMIIDKSKIVPTDELRIEDVKSNFDQISSQNKLTPFVVNTNEYLTVTESKTGTENGCFILSYDEPQSLFTVTGFGFLDSIDYTIRHDLVLNEQRKSKIESSDINVAKAKAYFVMLDDIGWGHIITDGTTEVFLCTYRPMDEKYVSFEQLYSSEDIIAFYKEMLF